MQEKFTLPIKLRTNGSLVPVHIRTAIERAAQKSAELQRANQQCKTNNTPKTDPKWLLVVGIGD
jgi:hypothetical protein